LNGPDTVCRETGHNGESEQSESESRGDGEENGRAAADPSREQREPELA
jgi:hypothetical protein